MYAVGPKARYLLGSGRTTLLFIRVFYIISTFVHCLPPPLPPPPFFIPFMLLRLCFSCCCRLYAYRFAFLFVSFSLFSMVFLVAFFFYHLSLAAFVVAFFFSSLFFSFLVSCVLFVVMGCCQVFSCVHLITFFFFFLCKHLCHCSLWISGIAQQCISTHPPFLLSLPVFPICACCGAKDDGEKLELRGKRERFRTLGSSRVP